MPVKRINSLTRGLDVLEAIARDQPVSASELARRLEIDRSALQRVLVTLQDHEWVRSTGPDRRWELGRRPRLVLGATWQPGLLARARPVLRGLRDLLDETVFLALREGDRVVIADVVESTQVVRTSPPIGFVIEPGRSSAALAIAASLPPAEHRRLGSDDERDPTTSSSSELAAVRRRGWATDQTAWHGGGVSVAAAISSGPHPLGAVVVCGPTSRMTTAARTRAGEAAAEAAGRLSAAQDPAR